MRYYLLVWKKKCELCSEELNGNRQRFCSEKCRNRHKYENNKIVYNSNNYNKQIIRALSRKLFLVEYKGGCCDNCGYKKNLATMEFHHINPNEKTFGIDSRKIANTKMETLKKEVDKCILLCSNCHREEHNPELEFSILNEREIKKYCLEIPKENVTLCHDCGIITKGSERCIKCEHERRRQLSNRPDLDVLKQEVLEHSMTWCGIKYGVSRTTIKRWLSN